VAALRADGALHTVLAGLAGEALHICV
jgi:hypothetical protein